MDISSTKLNETTIIDDFYYPNGELICDEKTGEPVWIEIYGTESEEFNKALARKLRADQMKNKGKRQKKQDDAPTEKEIREAKEDAVKTLADCTVNWGGFYDGGEPLECTKDNVVKVYKAYPFIRRRVDEGMTDESAFFEQSPVS